MHVVKKIFRILFFAVAAVVLLVAGVVVSLYSPWTQETLRKAIVEHFGSSGNVRIGLDSFKLRPPLRLELGGLCITEKGDTMIAARSLRADVALLPLLAGRAGIDNAVLEDGFYRMGAPDSAMYMTLRAGRLALNPASVKLSTMGIEVDNASLDRGRVDMVLNSYVTSETTESSDTTSMSVKLGRVKVHDLQFSMRMLPTIDSLGTTIADATLLDGMIDMRSQSIGLRSLLGTGLAASYIAPDSATLASLPPLPETSSTSAPWTVAIDTIGFDRSRGLYTTRGLSPLPGLDFSYIVVDSLQLAVHDFYNRATTVRVPLRARGTERCGVQLDTRGTLLVDSVGLRLDSFNLVTPWTALDFEYYMGMGDMATDLSLPIAVEAAGNLGTPDLRLMFPDFTPWLAGLPDHGIDLDADASGTMGRIDINRLNLGLNGCVDLAADGYVERPMMPESMGADVQLRGYVANAAPIARNFLDASTMKTVKIPPMSLNGRVWMKDGDNMGGNLKAVTHQGSLALDGNFNSRAEKYQATAVARQFPVNAFMPLLGVGRVDGRVEASGKGLDFLSPRASLSAHAAIDAAEYDGHTYTGITADATLENGMATVDLHSGDPDMLAHITASGNLAGDVMNWKVFADADRIDLKALKFATDETTINTRLLANASYRPSNGFIAADIDLDMLQMRTATAEYNVEDVKGTFRADSLVGATIANGDFLADLTIDCNLDTLLAHTDSISAAMTAMMEQKRLDAERLQRAIPRMNLNARGGSNNFINDILASSKTGIDSLSLAFSNDSTMAMNGRVLGIATPSMRIDTVGLNAAQYGSNLFFNVRVDNRPGTLDDFAHVALSGIATDNIAGVRVTQRNIEGKTGYDIGLQATMADSLATLSVMPLDPTIGYQPWTVNAGNFISYHFADKHIDANLHMQGAGSALAIYTEHVEGSHDQEDLVINVSDIHVQDWIALNPFAPPVKGDVSASIRLNRNDNLQLTGRGAVDLNNFFYGGERVAQIHADADVTTGAGGVLNATADIFFDGHRAVTLRGALNDSTMTSPLNLDLSVISLPLSVANPFLGASMGRLKGTLNGSLDIAGTDENPTLNGWLALDSAAVYLTMTATDYRISTDTVPVINNLATFHNFEIFGTNANPLSLNGTADISNFSSPKLNLALKASDMQVVNTSRAARGADIYGKAFISMDASVSGDFDFMRVDADLTINSGTNVTYVMPDAVETLQSRSSGDMVKFVNFSDSTAMAAADTITPSGMAMLLNASLTFEPASTVSVDLSSNGKDKVQLQPTGELTYTLTPMSDDGRLTGRLNINGGFARYTPPFMSEKNFRFNPESYVSFSGNMMNPTLYIKAVDVMKANVTQEGQNSRLVNFNVMLSVTGTLEQMKVEFDLSTDDDITVSNELQSMSPEQRANQAMNMLLYNIYSGPGTRGNAAIGGNALFSFLESKINSWAADNIKGVDLSFGIDQYNRTVDGNTSSTMSYSYQVSKSLFDDRFKIVVGGNYSTDANADENFSQNLINDISFEYFLNRAQTMYLRLFRHTGYESILEGEITKTGVGFVYKRKLNSLRDMFRRRHKDANQ